VLERGMIREADLELIRLVDDADEAVQIVEQRGAELRAAERAAAAGAEQAQQAAEAEAVAEGGAQG
jgi:hypothetical protein